MLTAPGSTLAYATTSGGTYTPCSEVRDITAPEITPSLSDVTHLGSPNLLREKYPSWADPGAAGFVFQFNHAQFAFMKTAREARTKYYWKITFPLEGADVTGSTLIFQARVNGLTPRGIAVGDEPITCEVKFAIVGGYSFVEGSLT